VAPGHTTSGRREGPAIEAQLAALDTVVEPGARGRLLREIGDHKFQEFAEMPLF
jgi:hypothetical protein